MGTAAEAISQAIPNSTAAIGYDLYDHGLTFEAAYAGCVIVTTKRTSPVMLFTTAGAAESVSLYNYSVLPLRSEGSSGKMSTFHHSTHVRM